jgi:hypothetical protein
MNINTHWLTYLIPILLALAVIVSALHDARHRTNGLRGVRIFEAVLGFYFIIVYIWAQTETSLPILRSGLITRIGVSLVLLLVLIDIRLTRKFCKDHNA